MPKRVSRRSRKRTSRKRTSRKRTSRKRTSRKRTSRKRTSRKRTSSNKFKAPKKAIIQVGSHVENIWIKNFDPKTMTAKLNNVPMVAKFKRGEKVKISYSKRQQSFVVKKLRKK